MTVGQIYVLGAGLTFLAVFVTGRRLSRLGRTQGTFLLLTHKILALCAAFLVVITAVRVGQAAGLDAADWAAALGAGALFVVTAASGGLVSARGAVGRGLRITHRAGSLLTMLVSALALYLLLVRV